jgi:hypothetical protein
MACRSGEAGTADPVPRASLTLRVAWVIGEVGSGSIGAVPRPAGPG